jgi:hypothetical protein
MHEFGLRMVDESSELRQDIQSIIVHTIPLYAQINIRYYSKAVAFLPISATNALQRMTFNC